MRIPHSGMCLADEQTILQGIGGRNVGGICRVSKGAHDDHYQKATEYCARAGERKMRLLAFEAACIDFERALQLLWFVEPDDPARRCELLSALGQAQTRSGKTAGAEETFDRAAAGARQLHLPA